jgi:hypothetical protein
VTAPGLLTRCDGPGTAPHRTPHTTIKINIKISVNKEPNIRSTIPMRTLES